MYHWSSLPPVAYKSPSMGPSPKPKLPSGPIDNITLCLPQIANVLRGYEANIQLIHGPLGDFNEILDM